MNTLIFLYWSSNYYHKTLPTEHNIDVTVIAIAEWNFGNFYAGDFTLMVAAIVTSSAYETSATNQILSWATIAHIINAEPLTMAFWRKGLEQHSC